MERIQCVIEGTTPLLLNRFTDAAAQAATSGTRASSISGDKGSPREQAEMKLYRGQDDKLVIPQPNLFRCLIDAGKFFKAGKSKVTTQKSSLIPACVSIPEVEIVIKHTEPWMVDTRIMGVKLMREIVDAAGKRIGLGDFRPDCKGPFGKFVVTRWVIESHKANGKAETDKELVEA